MTIDTLRQQVVDSGLDGYGSVVVLAGSKYVGRVRAAFVETGMNIEDPMKGLALRQRLRWLNRHVKR